MTNNAEDFASALTTLESDGDVDSFVKRFTDDAELIRPETRGREQGSSGAATFWAEYLAQFDQIHSEFSRVSEQNGLAVLEWTSTGALKGGRSIEYAGVSILDLDEAGLVTRFATYFDTQAFGGGPSAA